MPVVDFPVAFPAKHDQVLLVQSQRRMGTPRQDMMDYQVFVFAADFALADDLAQTPANRTPGLVEGRPALSPPALHWSTPY